MKIKELSAYLERLEKTAKRLEITKILSDLFEKTEANEIQNVVYLSLGTLAPNYESIILNLAEKMMIRILSQAYDIPTQKVVEAYKKSGDLGDVAYDLGSQQGMKGSGLTVQEVYEELVEIAKDNGEGSQERKVSKTSELIKKLDPLSARYVSRIPIGKLRLGFSEKTVIDALSQNMGINSADIESAYNIRPDIGFIAKLVKSKKLQETKPEIGVPVVPMLAARLNSTSEMIKKMGEVAVEPKYDGLRIFIHYKRNGFDGKEGDFIRIFTRNMNAIDINTFPELSDVGKYIKADEVILDTEAVGLDPQREGFLDFQKTIQRRRKHDIEKNASEIPLQFQVFDMLLLNGKSYMHEEYGKRRSVLEKVIVNGKLLRIDESTVTKDPEVIRTLHEKYLKMGLEGVVVKRSNGFYVSGRTGWNWVKMKEEEGQRGKLSDTIDCVIMGFTTGKGKRSGFGVGQFLAGVVDGDNFKTVTKVGTGISDKQFGELKQRLEKIKSKDKPKEYLVESSLYPDFWVTPKVVVELAADEITKSPKHTAGLALRFPRLIKFRDDKNASNATTLKELQDLLKIN